MYTGKSKCIFVCHKGKKMKNDRTADVKSCSVHQIHVIKINIK